ncbi:MAG: insulinase family protein [Parachlamydiaceae bacterium]|nr:insulinase family protein [Parachlamydiaceae bacterium]
MTTDNADKFGTIGQRYHDFVVTKSMAIDELQCHLYELIHVPTGAQVMHIAADDPENLFCLSFQTHPTSSNGVAHILEHTVLCGSRKFPVKDPFFAMTRRSLNTFMNALTGADFTCYPAATQVYKDFYNLLDVYLDAVFHPDLNPLSFLQEGHRLEFAVKDDSSSPLEYKGIVFNEMKGAMSSANSRLNEVVNAALFPDLTYGHNSGGDPKDIPTLTYQELKDFHSKYYHPSRCLFFFYGNMPLAEHLDFICKYTLNETEKVPPLPPLPRQKRFQNRKYVTAYYPVQEDEVHEGQSLISFAWLTCHVLEQEDILALSILEAVLLDTDASPLQLALLKSRLCKQVSSYIETDMSEVPFVITLKGCKPENALPLEELIKTTLKKIAEEGISLHQIENALHQLEFHRSEITGNHGPHGLSLFMRSALLKQHGANPEEGLQIHSLVEAVRKNNIANPNYFSDLINKYLLNNPHSVCVTLEPSSKLGAEELLQEEASLKAISENLTPEKIEALKVQTTELSAFQLMQEEADQNILPKVTHADVPKIARDFPLSSEIIDGLQVYHHATFTNGILYADLVYDLPKIPEFDLPLVRLFTVLAPQFGCGGRSYAENLEYIQAHTGGIGASLTFNLQARNAELFFPSIYIRGKALHRKAPKLMSLMQEIVTSLDFTDLPRLREVMMKHFIGLQNSLHQNSLRYAVNLSAAGLDFPSKIADAWYGLDYYKSIKEIIDHIDRRLPWLAETLSELKKSLLGLSNPNLILTCDAAMYDEIKRHKFYGLTSIPAKPFGSWSTSDYSLPKIFPLGKITASPIAFISKVFKTVSYAHPHAPGLNIAAFLADNLILHPKIREQGGAYGGGAICNSMAANFYFYSYRDPNISATLEAFEESIDFLLDGEFDDVDLEEAKLEMIQSLDSPIAPGNRGDAAYGWLREGKPQPLRQEFRTAILSLTKEQVVEAVKAQLMHQRHLAIPVVFASKDLLEKENEILREKGETTLVIEKI